MPWILKQWLLGDWEKQRSLSHQISLVCFLFHAERGCLLRRPNGVMYVLSSSSSWGTDPLPALSQPKLVKRVIIGHLCGVPLRGSGVWNEMELGISQTPVLCAIQFGGSSGTVYLWRCKLESGTLAKTCRSVTSLP